MREDGYPPPLCPNWPRFWFKGKKCGNTGLPYLDKPMLQHSACTTEYKSDLQSCESSSGASIPNSPAHSFRAFPLSWF